jgi:hypothetical protein
MTYVTLGPTLTRRPDWPERLAATIERARPIPFEWGVHDCALFAADCVYAVTGVDVLGTWRGRWSTACTARALQARHGGLLLAVSKVMGPALPAINMAKRGDLLLIDAEMPWVAVCDGSRWWAPSKTGLFMCRTSLSPASAFWPVGWQVEGEQRG